MNLPPYATEEDVKRCSNTISNFIKKLSLNYSQEQVISITVDIMNISYSHGGDYSSDIILKFAKGYFDSNLHLTFFNDSVEHDSD